MTRHYTPATAPRNEAHFSPYSPKEQTTGLATILSLMMNDKGFAFAYVPNTTARLCNSLGVTLEVK